MFSLRSVTLRRFSRILSLVNKAQSDQKGNKSEQALRFICIDLRYDMTDNLQRLL
jgi:hypothetical protein